jgi:hypothetical protein
MPLDFKYDVAFSFVKDDEGLASRLNSLLSHRLQTFLYSERQKELAGTDGEETFNRVFGTEARIVVVLYRAGWGGTPWTRIEATAIRNRAYQEGYDFTIFIPLDMTPLPAYLPKTRIWVGLSRWGEDGAATVIDARVQESGGVPHQETLAEKAARIDDENASRKATGQFLQSVEGVEKAKEYVVRTFAEIEGSTRQIESAMSSVRVLLEKEWPAVVVAFGSKSVLFTWHQQWSNTLDGSGFYVYLYQGFYALKGFRLSEPREIASWVLSLDREREVIGWRESPGTALLSPRAVAEKFLSVMVDRLSD